MTHGQNHSQHNLGEGGQLKGIPHPCAVGLVTDASLAFEGSSGGGPAMRFLARRGPAAARLPFRGGQRTTIMGLSR
jgi:hypothetical protein